MLAIISFNLIITKVYNTHFQNLQFTGQRAAPLDTYPMQQLSGLLFPAITVGSKFPLRAIGRQQNNGEGRLLAEIL
jgi:hypothetical protein